MLSRLLIFTLFVMSCVAPRAAELADSVRVHFRVNQTEIDSMLMGNNEAMRGFAERMQALASSDTLAVTINSVRITGAASPEGSIAYNEWLSRRRADAITRWLQGYFDFDSSQAQFTFKGRDWQGLLAAIESDPAVPYKQEVTELLHDIVGMHPGASASPAAAKHDGVARLKALRGGVPYRYLLQRHFPALRASEVFITAEVTKSDKSDLSDKSDKSDMTDDMPVIEVPDSVEVIEVSDLSDLSDMSDMSDMSDHRGYIFALKTNGVYDLCLTPNLGVEFPIGEHFSVGANWMYAWWKNHDRNRHWRVYGGDVNARYYFGGRRDVSRPYTGHNAGAPLQGHHVGVYAQMLLFQIANGKTGYISGIPGQDIWGKPWYGGGVEYGYSKRIARRFNLDFTLGVGYLTGQYNKYRHIDDCYVWQSSHRKRWFGPTKAEISLVWLIGKMKGGNEK